MTSSFARNKSLSRDPGVITLDGVCWINGASGAGKTAGERLTMVEHDGYGTQ